MSKVRQKVSAAPPRLQTNERLGRYEKVIQPASSQMSDQDARGRKMKSNRLKAMAGKIPGELIAAELSRSHGALAVKACELGLSLRTIPRGKRRIGASAPSVP
jgi:hypothetical protein